MSDIRDRSPTGRPPATAPGEPVARLWQARAVLLWERLWPALWAPATLAGAFLALALLGALPLLPGWLHATVLALFAAGFLGTLVLGLRRFAPPDADAARRRLERDSGLPHRPLHAMRDRVAGGDATAQALWHLHQQRLWASVRRLRVAPPHPNVAARDPLALRMLVVLVLFVAVAAARDDRRPRLAAALSPRFEAGPAAAVATLDLWVTPPDYTGLPPIFLKSGGGGVGAGQVQAEPRGAPADQPVAVPKGSLVLGRVSGGSGTPRLDLGADSTPFETVDSASFQIQRPVESGSRIAVVQGGTTLGAWPITVVPDQPPTIAFASPPAQSERAALRLDYSARDDYGLTAVGATIRLADAGPGKADGDPGKPDGDLDRTPLELPLALPGGHPREARHAGFQDLTAHPWAGLPVTLRLTATDGAGQTGQSEEFPMVLPERTFNHPVARAIVEQRKRLTLHPRDARMDVARALADLSARPGTYNGDIVVFMTLRTAVARLILDQEAKAAPEVQQLLWETALRLEDGGLSLAERDLRDAERRLAEALDRNATDEELKRLMDELQQAVDRFMEAMDKQTRDALERGEKLPEIPPELANRMMSRDDLQQMMDQMRQLAETGARDAARQMLAQLQQMMENMRAGAMAQGQQQQGQNQAWRMMRELQELTQRQQQLLDQSFLQQQDQMLNGQSPPQPGGPRNRNQQSRQGNQPRGQDQSQAGQQQALRRQLGDLMRRLGEQMGDIPHPLGRAERAMRDAERALQQGQPGDAVPPQTQAMDELQQGMQSYAEQLMNQMMGMQQPGGPGQPQDQARQGRGRDPFGRRPPGMGTVDGETVKIPDQSDLQRAREILDELRRRSGQYDRPVPEREYIDRLLKQF